MNEEIEDNKFMWNELVIVKEDAPEYLNPGKLAYICGMEKIQFQEVAEEYKVNIGDWVYTIEFDDGSDITIPEFYLLKTDHQSEG